MTAPAGAERRSPQAAIVGAGPAGFYTAEQLLRKHPDIRIRMIDRLPTPFGLVRAGVAPDHPKIKSVIAVFDRVAGLERFEYFGNVEVGRDVSVAELLATHEAVVLAVGAPRTDSLGIRGDSLPGVHGATQFVGWYNGHPDHVDLAPDLSHERAVVIGVGNVATDVCRMLLKPVEELARTDIAAHALERLARSAIREVVLLGRRGIAQSRISSSELRELLDIAGCRVFVDPRDLQLDAASLKELEHDSADEPRRNYELLQAAAARDAGPARPGRRLSLRFLTAPVAVIGEGKAEGIEVSRTCLQGEPFSLRAVVDPRAAPEVIPCGLVVASTGSRGEPIEGAPFDHGSGVIPNEGGRVGAIPGLYVSGWIKRGARGLIGSNRADGVETAGAILADLHTRPPGHGDLPALLRSRGVRVTSYADWKRLDRQEIECGSVAGKPREKFVSIADMLAACRVGDTGA